MANMQETLKKWGTSAWGSGGPTVTLQERDKRLCDACRNGDLEGVTEALQDGAEPGVQFRLALGEVTPIFLCAQKGLKDIAAVLIEYGADVNKKMDFDQTICLHHAASNDQPEMCEFLVSKGCNVNALDKLGRTPLMDAAEIGSIETVKVLIKNNADINARDKEDHTALSYCIDFVSRKEPKFYETAKFLVQNDADVNSRGKFANRTILHCAAAQGDEEFCRQLIEERNAEVVVSDNEGKKPIDYAEANKHDTVQSYLQQRQEMNASSCCMIL